MNDVFADVLAMVLAFPPGQPDDGDGYLVLVVDSATGETDALGPMVGADALAEADRVIGEIASEGLTGVTVGVVRLHADSGPVVGAATQPGSTAAPDWSQ